MKEANFPYSGYNLGWRFEHPDYFRLATEKLKKREKSLLFQDLHKILSTTIKHQLLIPEEIDGKKYVYTSVDDLIDQIETDKRKENNFYIQRIAGYGIVHLPNGAQVKQSQLIYLDDLRLRERIYHIGTIRSIWTPIMLDYPEAELIWQCELADLNAHRLTNCLKEMHKKLALPVSPPPEITEKDNGIFWIKDFKIYINPTTLYEQLSEHPNPESVDLEKYKIQENE